MPSLQLDASSHVLEIICFGFKTRTMSYSRDGKHEFQEHCAEIQRHYITLM